MPVFVVSIRNVKGAIFGFPTREAAKEFAADIHVEYPEAKYEINELLNADFIDDEIVFDVVKVEK